MHEVVTSNLRSKLFGKGLPEQMRSTAFAFLGLTAAAALTLVAIFAQLSFPLLSPAPLPAGPGEEARIDDGVSLAAERVAPLRRAVAPAAPPGPVVPGAGERAPSPEAAPASAGDTSADHPGAVAMPAPGPAAPSEPAPPADPASQTPPAAAPEPVPAAVPKPIPAADPAPPKPAPVPPPPAAAPAPPPPVAAPPTASAAAAASPPAHSNAGGNGKGNAFGHSK